MATQRVDPQSAPGDPQDVASLRDISSSQWKSGIAAWLGWLFDGFDMHIYTLVATPFVAQLLMTSETDDATNYYASLIQASFMVGWALGGGLFGRIGDRLGRARALTLTILTYAVFTGLSFFAMAWWHLLIFRFLAALGIGGEWAVGSALLSETWPRRWRPWIAAVLQSAVNIGIIFAMAAGFLLADFPYRCVFLIGVLPALLVLWIRRNVPEPEQWSQAKALAGNVEPSIGDLFRGSVRRITLLTLLVCALSLTAHWAFMYWYVQHLCNLPDLAEWTGADKTRLRTVAMIVLMVSSIGGNFIAAGVAKLVGYRRGIALMFLCYFVSVFFAYSVPYSYAALFGWFIPLGASAGVFGLFTMYLPPLFPVLLRTTGAGFCYNIGRIAAGVGIVLFGMFVHLGDCRPALFYSGFLFLPAAALAMFLPELGDKDVVA